METNQPSRAVTAAARQLSRAWVVSLATAVLMPFVTLGLTIAVLVWGDELRWYALLGAAATVSLVYNASRFVPRSKGVDRSTIPLSPVDAERFAR